MTAGHVASAACPPLLRADALALWLHQGISHEQAGSVIAAIPGHVEPSKYVDVAECETADKYDGAYHVHRRTQKSYWNHAR